MPPKESEPQKNNPDQPKVEPVLETHRSHTYEDDLQKAMNATEASVVQEMLETAREKEAMLIEKKKSEKQKKLYSFLSFFFVVIALASIGYGYYHYRTLTVPVVRTYSVGVFPTTEAIVSEETDIRRLTDMFTKERMTTEGKPTIAFIVSSQNNSIPLNVFQFFQFIESTPSEPFLGSIDAIRLGYMNTGTENVPFVILSVPDREVASKEFLIAESDLLEIFYKALAIDISEYENEIGLNFSGEYLYNLPVRTLAKKNLETNERDMILLYSYVTDHIIAITVRPEVLKSIYDTIIKQ